MARLFHAFHHDYEIHVEQTAEPRFNVVMTPYANRKPIVLHAYATAAEAEAAARKFPACYQTAAVKGFALQDKYFVNGSGKSVHISFAMDLGLTLERFRSVLDA